VNARLGRAGLAARLLLAQTLVALVAAATLWLVAVAVGPPLFRRHLHHVSGQVSAEAFRHAEEAFRSASAISIGLALLASLVAASAISAFSARRLAAPVRRLAAAAHGVADGRYRVRVPDPGIGAEYAELTTSFNAMAARLESVESTRRRLLADLAHEVRTPVATLDAYLDGLEDGVVPVDDASLAVLRAQTARLARLAEDVTAVSNAEEGLLDMQRRPTRPSDVVSAAVASAGEEYAAKGVSLYRDVEADLPYVSVDADRIGQVLANLLGNALRHTPQGGSVSVSARREPGGGVVLTVADTGEGIPAEHLPHVFERFYRVDRARNRAHGGSGIGLAIVKAIVEAHGGTATAQSAGTGTGASFGVHLPAAG
jgi:signal transduction histidine kinase